MYAPTLTMNDDDDNNNNNNNLYLYSLLLKNKLVMVTGLSGVQFGL